MHTTQNSRPFQQFKCHTSAPTWAWFRQRKGCRCEGHMPEIFRNTGRASACRRAPNSLASTTGLRPVKPNQADSKLVHAGVPHAKATSFQQKQTRSNRRTFITFGFGLKNPEPSWSSYLKINTTNRSISHPVRFLSANLPTNRQRLDRATRDQCALSEEEFAACMCHRDVRDDWSCHQNKIQEVTMSSLRRGFHCSHTN